MAVRPGRSPNILAGAWVVCASRHVAPRDSDTRIPERLLPRVDRDLAGDAQCHLTVETTALESLCERAHRRDVDRGSASFRESLSDEAGQDE